MFAVALAVRVLHVWQISAGPFFDLPMGDAADFHAWALELAGGEWLGEGVFYRAPLYPYFLGAVYALLVELIAQRHRPRHYNTGDRGRFVGEIAKRYGVDAPKISRAAASYCRAVDKRRAAPKKKPARKKAGSAKPIRKTASRKKPAAKKARRKARR